MQAQRLGEPHIGPLVSPEIDGDVHRLLQRVGIRRGRHHDPVENLDRLLAEVGILVHARQRQPGTDAGRRTGDIGQQGVVGSGKILLRSQAVGLLDRQRLLEAGDVAAARALGYARQQRAGLGVLARLRRGVEHGAQRIGVEVLAGRKAADDRHRLRAVADLGQRQGRVGLLRRRRVRGVGARGQGGPCAGISRLRRGNELIGITGVAQIVAQGVHARRTLVDRNPVEQGHGFARARLLGIVDGRRVEAFGASAGNQFVDQRLRLGDLALPGQKLREVVADPRAGRIHAHGLAVELFGPLGLRALEAGRLDPQALRGLLGTVRLDAGSHRRIEIGEQRLAARVAPLGRQHLIEAGLRFLVPRIAAEGLAIVAFGLALLALAAQQVAHEGLGGTTFPGCAGMVGQGPDDLLGLGQVAAITQRDGLAVG